MRNPSHIQSDQLFNILLDFKWSTISKLVFNIVSFWQSTKKPTFSKRLHWLIITIRTVNYAMKKGLM